MDSSNTLTYVLKRNEVNGADLVIYTGGLNHDTTVIDSGGLRGEGAYIYKFSAYEAGEILKDTAVSITASVLTPTGHEFEWVVDTLGEEGWMYDLWGLDENNLWGVGAVQLPSGASNVVYWNGNLWETVPSNLQMYLYGIYGFSANQIWVVGNGNYHWGGAAFWDGVKFTEFKFDADKPEYADTIHALHAIWGSAPNDVWAVGGSGTIIHWNGETWRKVPSPTKLYLYDIWGVSHNDIYAVGFSLTGLYELLHYDGISWKLVSDRVTPAASYQFTSIWLVKGGSGFIVGNRGFERKGNLWERIAGNDFSRISRVRGSGINNVFAGGQGGRLLHYNGNEWYRIRNFEGGNQFFGIKSMAVFENVVVISGDAPNGVPVWIGRRK